MNRSFDYISYKPEKNVMNVVSLPLPDEVAETALLTKTCHVDHEGFDLNEIEQLYHQYNKVSLTCDTTWYKDGGQTTGANAVIQPWIVQIDPDMLIVDHAHFVFRYPIVGDARKQILQYVDQRPELLRILSAKFKCGLDLCIDFFNTEKQVVEPIVHIEWDFDNYEDLLSASDYVESILESDKWLDVIPSILRYNSLCKKKKVDAFDQANTRSMLLFAEKSYKLIPTL